MHTSIPIVDHTCFFKSVIIIHEHNYAISEDMGKTKDSSKIAIKTHFSSEIIITGLMTLGTAGR